MTAINTDAEAFQGAAVTGPTPVHPRRLRIVGLVVLAAIGLAMGAVAGMLLVVSIGLIELC